MRRQATWKNASYILIVADHSARAVFDSFLARRKFVRTSVALAIAAQFAPVVREGFLRPRQMRVIKTMPRSSKAPSAGRRPGSLVGFVGHDRKGRLRGRPVRRAALKCSPRGLGQVLLPRTGRLQFASQMNTLAVDQPPSTLCLCPSWFFRRQAPPFSRGRNCRPETTPASQAAFLVHSLRNCRQILSHVPSSSTNADAASTCWGCGSVRQVLPARAGSEYQRCLPARAVLSAQGRPRLTRWG